MSIKNETSFFDYKVKNIDGKIIDLKIYHGNNLLIVNVASQCGLTPQYQELERIYRDYKDQGLVILGFPCNQFNQQEPGTSAEIKGFCERKYQITFPLFEKIEVNGENTHPLYTLMKKQIRINAENNIEWNFSKFLLNSDGHVLKYYAPDIEPAQIERDLITMQLIVPNSQ